MGNRGTSNTGFTSNGGGTWSLNTPDGNGSIEYIEPISREEQNIASDLFGDATKPYYKASVYDSNYNIIKDNIYSVTLNEAKGEIRNQIDSNIIKANEKKIKELRREYYTEMSSVETKHSIGWRDDIVAEIDKLTKRNNILKYGRE